MRSFAGRQSRGAALPDSVQARPGNAIGQALRHLRTLEEKSTYVMRTVQRARCYRRCSVTTLFVFPEWRCVLLPRVRIVCRDVETCPASLWFRSKNPRTESIKKGPAESAQVNERQDVGARETRSPVACRCT